MTTFFGIPVAEHLLYGGRDFEYEEEAVVPGRRRVTVIYRIRDGVASIARRDQETGVERIIAVPLENPRVLPGALTQKELDGLGHKLLSAETLWMPPTRTWEPQSTEGG